MLFAAAQLVGRRAPPQEVGQHAPGVGFLPLPGNLGRSTLGDDTAAAFARFRTHVDDPVGLGHHIQVVFDDHGGVTRIDQAVQHVDQLLHICHVQSNSGLIQHVERVSGLLPRPGAYVGAHLGELGDQFDALRFTTRECRALLAQGEIAEPDVLQQLQAMVHAWMGDEELDGLVDIHRQDVADAPFSATTRSASRS